MPFGAKYAKGFNKAIATFDEEKAGFQQGTRLLGAAGREALGIAGLPRGTSAMEKLAIATKSAAVLAPEIESETVAS